MKRTILVLVTLLLTGNSFAIDIWPTDSWPIASWPDTFTNILSHENAACDDDWILVGEVMLTRWVDSEQKHERIKADLYVREVAHKIIYRIGCHGRFYAIRKKKPEDDNSKSYAVTINDKTYYFDVQ